MTPAGRTNSQYCFSSHFLPREKPAISGWLLAWVTIGGASGNHFLGLEG